LLFGYEAGIEAVFSCKYLTMGGSTKKPCAEKDQQQTLVEKSHIDSDSPQSYGQMTASIVTKYGKVFVQKTKACQKTGYIFKIILMLLR